MVQRSNSSPLINDVSTKRSNAQSQSEPSNINLLKPNHNKHLTSQNKTCKKSTQKKNKSVKLWFMKEMVQVHFGNNTKTQSTLVPRCELTTPSSENCSSNGHCPSEEHSCDTSSVDETTYHFTRHAIRSNYMDKSIEAKKKVHDYKHFDYDY